MKYINKISRFMQGRYGFDELYTFLFYLYFILLCAGLVFHSYILLIMELILFIILFSRVFSKNIARRRKENQIYLKVKDYVGKPFRNIKRNWKDRKDFIYKKCHKCKTTLKLPLPSSRGFHHATCPKCKTRLRIFCTRRGKIEITKANGEKWYH